MALFLFIFYYSATDCTSTERPKIDLNWCLDQLNNGSKIIFLLYANDCQSAVQAFGKEAPSTPSSVHQSSRAIFQLKPINVETDEEELSVVSQVQHQSISSFPSQLSALVCILISGQMSQLINSKSSPLRHWLASQFSGGAPSYPSSGLPFRDSNSKGAPLSVGTFALYDDEMVTFQVKFKLLPLTYVAIDSFHQSSIPAIVIQAATKLCNETLYQTLANANQICKFTVFSCVSVCVNSNKHDIDSVRLTVSKGQYCQVNFTKLTHCLWCLLCHRQRKWTFTLFLGQKEENGMAYWATIGSQELPASWRLVERPCLGNALICNLHFKHN